LRGGGETGREAGRGRGRSGLLEVLGKKLYSVLASELRMADITRSATVTPLNISSPTGIP